MKAKSQQCEVTKVVLVWRSQFALQYEFCPPQFLSEPNPQTFSPSCSIDFSPDSSLKGCELPDDREVPPYLILHESWENWGGNGGSEDDYSTLRFCDRAANAV